MTVYRDNPTPRRRTWAMKRASEIKCDNKFKLKYGVGRKQYARISLINSLGGECVRCGFRDVRALQLDHVNGDGKQDRANFKANSTMYHFYIKNPELANQKLQVLCANCNWIKREEANEVSKMVIRI